MIVVDCSVIVAGMLSDEEDAFANKIFHQLADDTVQAIVPAIFYLELGNVLLQAYKKKRIRIDSY